MRSGGLDVLGVYRIHDMLGQRTDFCFDGPVQKRQLPGLPEDFLTPAFGASVGILIWSARHYGEKTTYENPVSILKSSKRLFNQITTSTGTRWKQTSQLISREFKKIYA